MQAVFHAAYTWLGIGIALKLLGAGLIFFVPGRNLWKYFTYASLEVAFAE